MVEFVGLKNPVRGDSLDCNQPVETDETPPRPVRVLFDKDGVAHAVMIPDEYGESKIWSLDGEQAWGYGRHIPLRNVPAKPVRHEGWVAVVPAPPNVDYDVVASGPIIADRDRLVKAYPTLKIAKIIWNSDGSPVDQANHGSLEWDELEIDRYNWKAKAEALEADVNSLKLLNGTQLTRIGTLKTEVNHLSSAGLIIELKSQVKMLQAVMDVAKAYVATTSTVEAVSTYRKLEEAIRAYNARQMGDQP